MRLVEGAFSSNAPSIIEPNAELALLVRALWREGYSDHTFGHVTVRQADGTFLTNPFELGWDEVRASDVLSIDEAGHRIAGRGSVTPAITLHVEFHKVRDDRVMLHHHPDFATLWSAVGTVPPAYDQLGAFARYDDIRLVDEYYGAVEQLDIARRNVEKIGQAKMALLANHGVVVAADSVPQAYFRATALERRCRQALMLSVTKRRKPMQRRGERQLLARMQELNNEPPHLWDWAVRRELRADPSVLD